MGKMANPRRLKDLARQVAELRRLVTSLKVENARLRAELAALRGEEAPVEQEEQRDLELGAVIGRNAAPRWLKANVKVVARCKPRRPRAPVPGRRRQEPDRQVIHALEECAGCGSNGLSRGEVVQRRQVVVLPPVRAEVVEHLVLARRCRQCGMVNRATMPDLSEEVGTGRRFGWRLVAEVALLRTKLRAPLRSLQWLVQHVWGVHVSQGALCGMLDETARSGRTGYDGLLQEARASPVLHVDETGWRQEGSNGFLWTLSTPAVRYFQYSHSRAGYVARRLVGEEYQGVVVSDFYTAYDQLDGLHQRCWAHVLREIHDLRSQRPADAAFAAWAQQVHALYTRADQWQAQASACTPAARETARHQFEQELLELCQGADQSSAQATLCNRFMKYLPELFRFVSDPAVPATNNAAERALRPLVVARKISGGTRSAQGSKTRMILQSLIATWEVREQDPVERLLIILQGHHANHSELAPV